MRYGLLGVSLALTWFLLVNVVTSAVVAGLTRVLVSGRANRLGRSGASLWFWLRLSPSAVAFLFVAGAVVPAYARLEPRDGVEPVGVGLCALTIVALTLIGWSLGRGVAGWRRALVQMRAWMRQAERLPWPAKPVPVFGVRDRFPAVSLVGICRQRLFVARQVLDVLTPEELQVVVDHELRHRSAWDNVKRLLLLASPDALALVPAGAHLERKWAQAAESAADCRATGGDARKGVALAAAVVKVARLMPAPAPLNAPVSNLYCGGPLAGRVQRLLSNDSEPRATIVPGVAVAVAALVLMSSAIGSPLLPAVHRCTELLVSLLA